VEDEADFWYWAVPTRVAPLVGIQEYNATQDDAPSADANGVTVYGTAGRWLEVDHEGNEWPYQVLAYAYGGEHKLRMVGTEVPDILGTFDLAFRNYRSYFEVDTDITLEAITWFGHWLWVVHRKNDLAGTNRRYLSVVDVNTPWPRPSYLEVMATLELEGLSVHDRITRVEFRHGDQQHVYIGDGLNTYVYSLYYDYFVVKGRTLYFREKPDRVSIVYPESARQVRTREEDASKMDRTHRRN